MEGLQPAKGHPHLVPEIGDPPPGQPGLFRLVCRLMDAQRRVGGKRHVEGAIQLFQFPDGQMLKAAIRPEPQVDIYAVRQTVQQPSAPSGSGGTDRHSSIGSRGGAFLPRLHRLKRVPFLQHPHVVQLLGVFFQNVVPLALHARAANHRHFVPQPCQVFGQLGGTNRADGVLRSKVIADDQRTSAHWPFPPFFAASGKRAGSRAELQQQCFQCSHALRRIRSVSSSVREASSSSRFSTP